MNVGLGDRRDGLVHERRLEQMGEVFAVLAFRRLGERLPVLASPVLHVFHGVVPEDGADACVPLFRFGVAFAWMRPCIQSGLVGLNELFPFASQPWAVSLSEKTRCTTAPGLRGFW